MLTIISIGTGHSKVGYSQINVKLPKHQPVKGIERTAVQYGVIFFDSSFNFPKQTFLGWRIRGCVE